MVFIEAAADPELRMVQQDISNEGEAGCFTKEGADDDVKGCRHI